MNFHQTLQLVPLNVTRCMVKYCPHGHWFSVFLLLFYGWCTWTIRLSQIIVYVDEKKRKTEKKLRFPSGSFTQRKWIRFLCLLFMLHFKCAFRTCIFSQQCISIFNQRVQLWNFTVFVLFKNWKRSLCNCFVRSIAFAYAMKTTHSIVDSPNFRIEKNWIDAPCGILNINIKWARSQRRDHLALLIAREFDHHLPPLTDALIPFT